MKFIKTNIPAFEALLATSRQYVLRRSKLRQKIKVKISVER